NLLQRQILEARTMEMQYSNWISQAREHWAEHLPKKFARLKKSGTLEKALIEAAQATSSEMQSLQMKGATWQEAWEQTRELYLFPPEEPEQTPKMPKSQGYLAMVEYNRALASLGMPKED
ncbi:MAG: hypothetical protein ACK5A0_11530, partial [Polaromonas sp.]